MNEVDYNTMSAEQAKEYFNKNYNISYVDESLPTPPNDVIFKHYVSSAFIYALALFFCLFNPFYITAFRDFPIVKEILVYIFFAYLVFAPILLFIFKPRTVYVSHSVEVMNYLLKLCKREGLPEKPTATEFLAWLKPSYKQTQSLILYFIKFYFGPQMVVWTAGHFNHSTKAVQDFLKFNAKVLEDHTFMEIFNIKSLVLKYRTAIFGLIFAIGYFVDTFVYAIGYVTELTFLRNRIRTVESSVLGLFFCLMCYPYFSSVTASIVPWPHNESNFNGLFPADPLNILIWILMILAVIFLFIYVAASVALFTKASNLTNRGTVKIFPYNIIRHPAYSAKIAMWLCGSIVPMKYFIVEGKWIEAFGMVLGSIVWTFIYYMRAMTEERHLSLDPDYREYCKKVKYRFIPKVW